MSIIGQARLAMYDLFFNRPICDYSTENGTRVLILGDGVVRDEAFKAAFSLGQSTMPLHITVAAEDGAEFGRIMLDEKGSYPDLMRFAQNEGYADLAFTSMTFTPSDVERCVRELQSSSYNYIIITLEEKRLVKSLATAIAKRATSTSLICSKFPELTYEIVEPNVEVYAYGMEDRYTELLRLAQNINFSCAMKTSQRVSRNTADAGFHTSLDTEFYSESYDFLGPNYDADSSLACAAHIPAKLALCKQLSNSNRFTEDILKESIVKKNNTYNQLIQLEHRRWVAYMAMRGFRAPTPEEEQTLLYQYIDGRFIDHRDKSQLLHICMCTSDSGGIVLGNDDLQWKKDPSVFSSMLDRASVRAHRLAATATETLIRNKNALLSQLDLHDPYHKEFKYAVEKLLNNDCNSLLLYEKAKDTVSKQRPQDVSVIEDIDAKLRVVKCRNQRTDFVAIDAELIDFLPFCLWYRKKYKSVITITCKVPVKDVVIPTIFCAEKAIFLGPDIEKDDAYQARINKYFIDRGNNTNAASSKEASAVENAIYYKNCDIERIDDILSSLEAYKRAFANGEAILSFVGRPTDKIALAVGMFLQQHEAQAVYYDATKGVVSVSGYPHIAAGLDNKSFSVSEIIELIGGSVKNPYSRFSCESDREKWVAIFKEFCRKKAYYKNGDELVHYNTWVQMSTLFQQEAKDTQHKIHNGKFDIKKCDKTVKNFSYSFSKEVFASSGVDIWLHELTKYKIIANYTSQLNECTGMVKVAFDYCEYDIVKILKDIQPGTRLHFTPEGGIRTSNMQLNDVPLFVKKDTAREKHDKLTFMSALADSGFLEDLSPNSIPQRIFEKRCDFCKNCKKENCEKRCACANGSRKVVNTLCSFRFKDEHIRWLLKQQGATYEEVIYHLARHLGQFDDVQTGVKIAWTTDAKTFADVLNDKLKSTQLLYGPCGYYILKQATIEAKAALNKDELSGTDNEIDVIAVKGMTPIFMSAKTNKDTSNGWIYEIKSVSDHFGALPVMIIAQDCDKISTGAFAGRAAQMNVSLIGLETMWDEDRLRNAFAAIASGQVVKPREIKQKELLKDEI